MTEGLEIGDKVKLQDTYPAAWFYKVGHDKTGTIVREEQGGFVKFRPDPAENVADITRSDILVRTEHVKLIPKKSVDGQER